MKNFKIFLKESYTVYIVVTAVLLLLSVGYVLFFNGNILYALCGVVLIILLMMIVEYIMWCKGK